MHSTSAPNAMSTNAQPKFEMIHDKVADMTAPRFSGATSPYTTNAAMTNADPQNTAGSMLLKVPFMCCLSSTRGGGVARPNYVSFVRTGRLPMLLLGQPQ